MSQDVVAVFDTNQNQLFADARPVKAAVKPAAKFMRHPAETGATFVDHIVFEPTEITLSMVLTPATYRDTWQQIKSTWKKVTALTVQTKTDTFSNMYIEKLPFDEDPEIFDTVILALSLVEVILVAPQFAPLPQSKVKNKSNSDTQKTGQQQGKQANPQQQSLAHQIFFGGG